MNDKEFIEALGEEVIEDLHMRAAGIIAEDIVERMDAYAVKIYDLAEELSEEQFEEAGDDFGRWRNKHSPKASEITAHLSLAAGARASAEESRTGINQTLRALRRDHWDTIAEIAELIGIQAVEGIDQINNNEKGDQ